MGRLIVYYTYNHLKKEIEKGTATLVYGAKDEEHNEAVVLKEYLSH